MRFSIPTHLVLFVLAASSSGCTSSELKLAQNDPASPSTPAAPAAPRSGVLGQGFDPLASDAAGEGTHAGHSHAAPAADAGAQKYTCPMHPEVVKDEPGVCPKCNMKLVPKKDANVHEH